MASCGRRGLGLSGLAGLVVAVSLWAGCQGYELVPIQARAMGVRNVRVMVTGKPLPSNVMLVVDKSGSMTESVTGTGMSCTFDGTSGSEYDSRSANPCKWNDLKAAFTDPADGFLVSSRGLARFGLLAFPGDGNSCAEGAIAVPIGEDVEAIRRALMTDLTPAGGTPTTAALLEAARDPLLASSEPNRQRFVMLLTDGLPNCNDANAALCSQCRANSAQCSLGCRPTDPPFDSCDTVPFDGAACLDEESLVTAIRQLRSQGIVTFVIGFGRATASGNASRVLDRAAIEGGHPRLGASEAYYQANSVEELKGFLEELLKDFPCTFPLDPKPSERDLLTVNLHDNESGRPDADRILKEDTDWEFTSESLDAVRLLGSACDLVQNAKYGKYEVQIIYADPL